MGWRRTSGTVTLAPSPTTFRKQRADALHLGVYLVGFVHHPIVPEPQDLTGG